LRVANVDGVEKSRLSTGADALLLTICGHLP